MVTLTTLDSSSNTPKILGLYKDQDTALEVADREGLAYEEIEIQFDKA